MGQGAGRLGHDPGRVHACCEGIAVGNPRSSVYYARMDSQSGRVQFLFYKLLVISSAASDSPPDSLLKSISSGPFVLDPYPKGTG